MFNSFLFLSYFWVEIFFIGKLWYFRYFCEMNLYMKLYICFCWNKYGDDVYNVR